MGANPIWLDVPGNHLRSKLSAIEQLGNGLHT